MSVIEKIRQYIEQIPVGKPFSASALWHCSSTDNARQALNRLVQQEVLKRVSTPSGSSGSGPKDILPTLSPRD